MAHFTTRSLLHAKFLGTRFCRFFHQRPLSEKPRRWIWKSKTTRWKASNGPVAYRDTILLYFKTFPTHFLHLGTPLISSLPWFWPPGWKRQHWVIALWGPCVKLNRHLGRRNEIAQVACKLQSAIRCSPPDRPLLLNCNAGRSCAKHRIPFAFKDITYTTWWE